MTSLPPLISDSYNNPGGNSHPRPWRPAVDRIHLALLVAFLASADLRARLRAVKESAGHRGETHHKGIEHLQLGPYLVRVWPTGARIGQSGPYFAFVVEFEGVVIMIQDRAAPKGECPNVLVTIGGLASLELGDLGALELAYNIIRQMGGEIEHVALSRNDFCVDMPGVGMDEFVEAAKDGRFVTRGKCYSKIAYHSGTVEFGRPPLVLQVYDKRAEVLSKQNPRPRALMLDRRWNGAVPAQAVRVEFRLGRAKLREFGIDAPEDFYRKRRAVVDYLCTQWFRFTAGPVDRANTTRAPTLPLWTQVHEAFAAWAGQPNGEVLEPVPRGPVDVDHLLRQSYGISKKIGREVGRSVVGYDAHCDLVMGEALYAE